MAALTDAMKWYTLGGQKAARLKYHFQVEFFSPQYNKGETVVTESIAVSYSGVPKLIKTSTILPSLQDNGRAIFDCVRSVELPKYSIETEVMNSWNIRHLVPTKINFEPISISFTDTMDNRFMKFISNYMSIVSGSFRPATESFRNGFDEKPFGIQRLDTGKDCPIDKIEITQFYGANPEKSTDKRTTTLWRPKIVDIQHDTLDYNTSEAVTWQIGFRYESITYEISKPVARGYKLSSNDQASNTVAIAESLDSNETIVASTVPTDQSLGPGEQII